MSRKKIYLFPVSSNMYDTVRYTNTLAMLRFYNIYMMQKIRSMK